MRPIKLVIFLPLTLTLTLRLWAQSPQSAHQHHLENVKTTHHESERDYDRTNKLVHTDTDATTPSCFLKKTVYGWHPHWKGTAYRSYDFAMLSTVSYFSYEVDPKTGSYKTLNQWRETDLVDLAHEQGTQVDLTATLFGASNHRTFFGNPQAVATFCDSIVAVLQAKDGDGICIDFEGLPGSERDNFTALIRQLKQKMRQQLKDAELTVVLYAVDWNKVFDIAQLKTVADRFVIMAYDYHWASAKTAGPVAPLSNSEEWGDFSVKSSIDYYLKAGASRDKLLVGVPYYGYKWPVKSENVPSAATETGKAVLLSDAAQYSAGTETWDSASTSPYRALTLEGGPEQLWMDDAKSLRKKYKLVYDEELAGIGIWALGYDHGTRSYWELLKSSFAECKSGSSVQSVDEANKLPGSDGVSSRERNKYNWIYIAVGFGLTVVIIWVVRGLMKEK